VAPQERDRLDVSLRPLVEEPDEGRARAALESIVGERVLPLVREIVRSQLGGSALSESDREDASSGALLRLSQQLWALRKPEPPEPIADLDAYVAVTTFNACHACLRRRFPEMTRLRNRLRYVLTHDAALALWPGPARTPLCGLSSWRERSPGSREALIQLRGRFSATSEREFPRLVRGLLREVGAPCRFDELADLVAEILGVTDTPRRGAPANEGHRDPLDSVADRGPSPERRLEWREYLPRLWNEIRLLPARQRVALLLNLRDEGGQSVTPLFLLLGIAPMSTLAETLGMSLEALAGLWPELPKDDHWIAGHLQLTRRQVINLRKCARERLGRRLGTL
jgi:hypothetical protein